jgi:hypothetical protein
MDSFGHSSTIARVFEEMGFQAMFFPRMNESQKTIFKRGKEMQFVWQPTYQSQDD